MEVIDIIWNWIGILVDATIIIFCFTRTNKDDFTYIIVAFSIVLLAKLGYKAFFFYNLENYLFGEYGLERGNSLIRLYWIVVDIAFACFIIMGLAQLQINKGENTMSGQIGKTVNVGKSVGASLILTFLFGPLGMFYSTVIGGIIMLILYIVIGTLTLGVGLVILHPIAMIWGAVAVSSHNKKISSNI